MNIAMTMNFIMVKRCVSTSCVSVCHNARHIYSYHQQKVMLRMITMLIIMMMILMMLIVIAIFVLFLPLIVTMLLLLFLLRPSPALGFDQPNRGSSKGR
jgi:hypothetical protein